jgi:splicing factor 3B subunit 3
VGDKFGNVLVLRLPENAIDDIDNPTGSKIMWDQGLLNGAPTKLNNLTHFYVGEAITSVVKSNFVEGGPEVIVVSTIYGSIYVFIPFKSKEDYGFFQHLEMFMRQEQQTLCQRDHMSYRSYYQPVKSTIDGDLCERYSSLLYIKQKEFADDTGRTPAEVFKRLEEMRNML